MTTQGTFWSLVKHDMKRRKRRNVQYTKGWRLVYMLVIALVILVATTYASMYGRLEFTYIWFFSFSLPFVSFGLSVSKMVREWKNSTVGWWLALPVSRQRLVASKFIASSIRGILVFLAMFVCVAVLSLYAMILQGTFTSATAGEFLLGGAEWYGLIVCVCPFVSAFGVFYGALSESRAKPVIPLVALVFGCSWWLVFSRDTVFFNTNDLGHAGIFTWSPLLWLVIVGSWVLSYVILRISAYLLERQLIL